ncbi:Ribosomal RNA large subunit methyltransferase J [Shimia sp. SK013]|uniref:23S rRNA (adenine(2030)-N(6))-methyltransferase RlmJ n=1 Tax=Shimia sp. SK013 TaxID=1389006 RepID=UPI0006B4CB55|nr:23S rRNA (adenine(2030)-N(6))-methyltransferase RlmJ [Shimia sp. SK013]KPA21462.1 Ribosomal RNA large subunit methyltransferase J [Shimia sp. SK013]
MLSYQHIYHAGNLADVHKHALLACALDYMTQKPKPLSYLETHSGRGLYHLDAAEAVKTGEAEAGIGAVVDWFGADHPYAKALSKVRDQHGAAAYPGSPVLAASLLRPADQMHLAELHPQECEALREAMFMSRAKVYQQDGFEMAQAVCPPTPRRGMLLIDPSYEIKTDYATIPGAIAKLNRKWNVGVIALWYPILTDDSHTEMVGALLERDLPGALCHEVRFPPARDGHRMVGSGMFFVNAPFGLQKECDRLEALFASLSA